MPYFNYNPYFCYRLQRVINYLKSGGLIPKGQWGWLTRFGRGFWLGIIHPFTKFAEETFTKTVSKNAALKNAKAELSKLSEEVKTLTGKKKTEVKLQISELQKEISNLEKNSEVVTADNTAGKVGNVAGKLFDASQALPPVLGIGRDIVGFTPFADNDYFGQHTWLGIGSTIPGKILNTASQSAGFTMFPANAKEAYGTNNSSDNSEIKTTFTQGDI